MVGKIESILDYMVHRYEEELQLPSNPHCRLYDFGKGLEEAHFFGPIKPLPENYKAALDFYQCGIKNYLEWYMKFNNGESIELRKIECNWDKKTELDKTLKLFNPERRNLFDEYKKSKGYSTDNQEDERVGNKSPWKRIRNWITRKNHA